MQAQFSVLAFVVLFAAACSSHGKIVTQYDEFNEATVIQMSQEHKAREGLTLAKRKLLAKYTRILWKGSDQLKLRLSISAQPDELNFDQTMFFGVDGRKFPLKMSKRFKTTSSTSYYGSKPSSEAGKLGESVPMTAIHNQLNSEVRLPAALAAALRLATAVQIRIYINDTPYSFLLSDKEVRQLQDFLNTTGGPEQ